MVSASKNHFRKHKFVDREGHTQTFTEAVKNLGQKELNVLVYYGVAGIGKTSLRKELPKYLEERNLEYQHQEVIWASIDLQLEKHREKTTFLVTLKNELQKNLQGRRKINFPAFEIAHAIYWKKANPEIPLRKENYLFFEGDNVIDDFFGTVDQIPYFQLVPAVARALKNVPDYLRKWWKIKGESELSQLSEMEALEIEEMLPYFWAQDLENYLEYTSESTVIFIDTYEALWENHRSDGNSRDKWIREELIFCSPKKVLWVICGREKLRWEESKKKWKNYLDQYEVEELLRKYCMEYLNNRGITDEEIQEAIFKGSKGIPYYLELSVNIYEKITDEDRKPTPEDFGDNHQEIATRFFRYLTPDEKKSLKVLAIPRFWDYDLFEYLVTKFNTGYTTTDYEELCSFSFITSTENDNLQMHHLMQECLKKTQEKERPDSVKRIHEAILEYYSDQIKDLDIKSITPEHENALTEASYHAKEALEAEELFNWFISVSDPFYRAAFWKFISPMYEEMQQILEANLGPEHPSVATTLNNLAGLYKSMGEYEKALPLYKRALEIYEKVLGPEHPDVATTLNGLAGLYESMGEYEKALPLYKRALETREKVLGPEHPSVATTLNGLAGLYYHIEKYDEALPLLERSLEIFERKLGPAHPYFKMNEQNIQILKEKMKEK
jgi:tetratricopeptide (TPR) repeat protein